MRLNSNRIRASQLDFAGMAAGLSAALRNRGATAPHGAAAPELIQSALVDGILMRWEQHGTHGDGAGSGVPVVMLHGIPTHPRLFRYVIPRVAARGVRCLAWELVGFGGSMAEGLSRDISLGRQAEYLLSWLNHLDIARAVLVGHDLGGGVVQRFAAAHPERCAGLVLADAVAYDNWPVPAVRAARAMSGMIARLPPALLKPALFAGFFNLGHDAPELLNESVELHWRHYAGPIGPAAFAHQLRSLDNGDTKALAGQLAKLSLPARVIWGEQDPLGLESAERLASELRAPLRRIPGGRHFTPEDHPDVVADAINELLAQSQRETAPGAQH